VPPHKTKLGVGSGYLHKKHKIKEHLVIATNKLTIQFLEK
jgi:hypothetical protein